MEQQLRLADRRGVFTRPISAPAEFGLMILQMLDNNRSIEREVHSVKVALAGNDPSRLPELFPQWFPPLDETSEEGKQAIASGDAVEDYSAVKWASPSSDPDSVEEMMRLSEALFANSQVTVTQNNDGEWI
jgi:hypothetical protein